MFAALYRAQVVGTTGSALGTLSLTWSYVVLSDRHPRGISPTATPTDVLDPARSRDELAIGLTDRPLVRDVR
jgi:hypothetical protein